MRAWARRSIGTAGAVAAGFVIGWFSRPLDSVSDLPQPANRATPIPPHGPAPASIASVETFQTAAAASTSDPAMPQRLATLLWLRERGILAYFPLLKPGPNVRQLDAQFANVFDLAPTEVARLNEAVERAYQRVNAAAKQKMTVQHSPDGTKLIVETSSQPAQSAAIYDELVQAFSAVLGPDRYAAVQQLAAPSLENLFDGLGLNDVRYEVTREPSAVVGGQPMYRIRRFAMAADGGSTGGESLLPASHIGQFFPLLASLPLPEVTSSPPTP